MTLLELAQLKPADRVRPGNVKSVPEMLEAKKNPGIFLAYCQAHQAELASLSASALDFLGRLCCHASTAEAVAASPIIGDVKVTANQQRESELFGNGEDLEATYKSLAGDVA